MPFNFALFFLYIFFLFHIVSCILLSIFSLLVNSFNKDMLRYEITASYFVYLNPSSDYNYSFQTWSGGRSCSRSGFRILTGSPGFDRINRVTGFFLFLFFFNPTRFQPRVSRVPNRPVGLSRISKL